MKILLLEDEYLLSRAIRTFLLSGGHLVDDFDNGAEVLEVIENTQHDFYILDINTPLVGGLECLKRISQKYPNTPKIIISAYNDIAHISEAFEIGCNDYLKKPFNLQELKIRVEHLASNRVQEVQKQESPIIHLTEHYSFNKEENQLYHDDVIQIFTKKEHALIMLFVSNLGQILTDETIQSVIWDGEYVGPSTIRSLVNRLRAKLDEDIIENVRGFGYMMKKLV
jgi:DNA-binding response OmpR family regulator